MTAAQIIVQSGQVSPLGFGGAPIGNLYEKVTEEEAQAALATAQGWKATSLGPLLLRTETVAAAVLGAVRVWSGLEPGTPL